MTSADVVLLVVFVALGTSVLLAIMKVCAPSGSVTRGVDGHPQLFWGLITGGNGVAGLGLWLGRPGFAMAAFAASTGSALAMAAWKGRRRSGPPAAAGGEGARNGQAAE